MLLLLRIILGVSVSLTADIVQSCEMKEVVRGKIIPWDPVSTDIVISTNSKAGSDEYVVVYFYDDNGELAGGLGIGFYSPIKYYIVLCSSSSTTFPETLPTDTDKTWRLSYNPAEKRLLLHCNGEEVLNKVLSDSVCGNGRWREYWGRYPTQIKFYSTWDTASRQYCLAGKVECSELPKDNGWDDDNLRVLNPTDFTTNPVEYGTTITVGCNPGYTLMKDGAEVAELMIECKGGPDNFVDRWNWTDTLSPISCDIKQPSPTDDGNTTVIVLLIVAAGIGVAVLIVLIWMIAACVYMARHPHTKFGDVMCCKTGRKDNCDLPEVGNEFQSPAFGTDVVATEMRNISQIQEIIDEDGYISFSGPTKVTKVKITMIKTATELGDDLTYADAEEMRDISQVEEIINEEGYTSFTGPMSSRLLFSSMPVIDLGDDLTYNNVDTEDPYDNVDVPECNISDMNESVDLRDVSLRAVSFQGLLAGLRVSDTVTTKPLTSKMGLRVPPPPPPSKPSPTPPTRPAKPAYKPFTSPTSSNCSTGSGPVPPPPSGAKAVLRSVRDGIRPARLDDRTDSESFKNAVNVPLDTLASSSYSNPPRHRRRSCV